MSHTFAVMHFFENQARLSNNHLKAMTDQQDDLLKQKENWSSMLEKLTRIKEGGYPSDDDLKDLQNFANNNCGGFNLQLDPNAMAGRYFDKDHGNVWRSPMADSTNTDQKKNIDKMDAAIKAVQGEADRVNDKMTSMNTKTQRYLTETNDAEARSAGLMSEYKSLLQELRK